MPITLPITPATAWRLVIPDIHGFLKTSMALLGRIALTPTGHLFLLKLMDISGSRWLQLLFYQQLT